VTLILTLDRVKSCWCAYPVEVYPHTKLDRNRKKNFLWTDGRRTYVGTDGQIWVPMVIAGRWR